MNTHSTIRNFIISLAILAVAAAAGAADLERHNPYTVLGLQIRTNLIPEQTAGVQALSMDRIPPTVFQEIVPCRLVSTLQDDHYAQPWGGTMFAPQESRAYNATGMLIDGNWTNPCSDQIPNNAIALSLRLQTHTPQDTGIVWLTAPSDPLRQPALPFVKATDAMDEANVMLAGGRFSVMVDAPTDLTVDVIGYFLVDPNGYGQRGEKGEKGDTGATGAQGLKGDKGDQGDPGVAGAQGDKGDRGETGAQGAQGIQGEKGDKGDRGETGAQGAQGIQGEKGDKGDRGETGAQGAPGIQGEKGDKGDRGETGAQGAQGIQGEKGDKGDRGETGAQGAQGAKGDKGDRGEAGPAGTQGAQGPMGPMGPMGPQGPKGEDGKDGKGISIKSSGTLTFPPPGSITIHDSSVTRTSVIIVQYVEVSNGNAIALESQSDGSFVASGSPNKKFKYYVFNLQ